METRPQATVALGPEHETGQGWSYELTIRWSGDGQPAETRHTVLLSWPDLEQLAGGLTPPSRVAQAAVEIASESGRHPLTREAMPARFDVATLRRLVEGFDDLVRDRLGRGPL